MAQSTPEPEPAGHESDVSEVVLELRHLLGHPELARRLREVCDSLAPAATSTPTPAEPSTGPSAAGDEPEGKRNKRSDGSQAPAWYRSPQPLPSP
jgi:hypothetical protein